VKFYITIEGVSKLKKSFLNLKLFSIICVPEILESFGYTYSTVDEYGAFIVSKKINNMIKTYSRSKRIRGIIYSNPTLNLDLIPNLFTELEKNDYINEVVLFDNYDVPKLKHMYDCFDEILFFPGLKKIRLIESVRFPGYEIKEDNEDNENN